MKLSAPRAPQARLTLRAYRPAPARVELVYRPAPGRLLRTLGLLLLFWGAIPLLVWVPPHYPWVVGAFCAGAYLAFRSWTGRFRIHLFAGLCPRCGGPVSMGVDRVVDLPHTLTCFHCHFEPRLEVTFPTSGADASLTHQADGCVGDWELRWLADAPFVVCDGCLASLPASPAIRAAARAENATSALLRKLADEGRA